jgi:hypothetical protein
MHCALTEAWLFSCPSAPFFCEENVWKVCQLAPSSWGVHAVVISNAAQTVAMWGQRAAMRDPIVWDYHVVAVATAPSLLVLDVDTRGHALCPLGAWLRLAFRAGVPDAWSPRFRVLAAEVYIEALASDRRHMLDPRGAPLRHFPPWPPPHPDRPGTLTRLIDPGDSFVTPMIDLDGLARRFGLSSPSLTLAEPS